MKKKKPSKPRISRSSKEWDVTIPYKCLEDVTLSGELLYKGKLSWTRKLAALTDGRMVCYKPEKVDSKPALVIQLTGYEASFLEKENRRGFDVRLLHPSLETHMFSVDFKDWAQLWVQVRETTDVSSKEMHHLEINVLGFFYKLLVFPLQYMNAMSKGKPPPGQHQHLVRGSTFNGTENGKVYGSKVRGIVKQSYLFDRNLIHGYKLKDFEAWRSIILCCFCTQLHKVICIHVCTAMK